MITLVRLNKYDKTSLMGTLIHLVIQINLLLVIERYRQSETVLIELKALNVIIATMLIF